MIVLIYEKLHSNYKPTYAKSLYNRLYDQRFLRSYGNILKMIIDSNEYWNKLRQRVDFLVYANVLKHSNTEICPKESHAVDADALFNLIKEDIQRMNLDYEEILSDELFRQFTRCIKGNFVYSDINYEYFSAPYFSNDVYGDYPDQGTIYLDNLTSDLFEEPLENLVIGILERIRKL